MPVPQLSTTTSLADILLQHRAITATKIGELQAQAQQEHQSLDSVIERSGAVREEDLLKAKGVL